MVYIVTEEFAHAGISLKFKLMYLSLQFLFNTATYIMMIFATFALYDSKTISEFPFLNYPDLNRRFANLMSILSVIYIFLAPFSLLSAYWVFILLKHKEFNSWDWAKLPIVLFSSCIGAEMIVLPLLGGFPSRSYRTFARYTAFSQ